VFHAVQVTFWGNELFLNVGGLRWCIIGDNNGFFHEEYMGKWFTSKNKINTMKWLLGNK